MKYLMRDAECECGRFPIATMYPFRDRCKHCGREWRWVSDLYEFTVDDPNT